MSEVCSCLRHDTTLTQVTGGIVEETEDQVTLWDTQLRVVQLQATHSQGCVYTYVYTVLYYRLIYQCLQQWPLLYQNLQHSQKKCSVL